ncbi:MAG TPA: protein phosphatase 2C domain-containing protein [Pirellulales bacterium]|nr:protein phosphatase 2C domain-containing protein [Pirellulales bacterium]
MKLHFAAASRAGHAASNDDRWFADPIRGCFVVADGVGQSPAGGLAATIAVECLPRLVDHSSSARGAAVEDREAHLAAQIERLNALVCQESAVRPALGGLQTTLVVAVFRAGRLLVAHLGDSRAYRWSRGSLRRLTEDHNLQTALKRVGAATGNHSRRQLRRFLGMPAPALPEVHSFGLTAGDVILLCTDGLARPLGDDEIAACFIPSAPLQATADSLVARAQQLGGTDDMTALLVAAHDRIP